MKSVISMGTKSKAAKAAVKETTKAIVKILKESKKHRNPEVAMKALTVLGESLDFSVNNTSVTDCSFTVNE